MRQAGDRGAFRRNGSHTVVVHYTARTVVFVVVLVVFVVDVLLVFVCCC